MCLGKGSYNETFTFKYLVMKNSKEQKIVGMVIVKNTVKSLTKKWDDTKTVKLSKWLCEEIYV